MKSYKVILAYNKKKDRSNRETQPEKKQINYSSHKTHQPISQQSDGADRDMHP